MKKQYITPQLHVVSFDDRNIICTSYPSNSSNPYGPNSVIIPIGGEEGEEEVAPPPSRARGVWG